MDAQKIAIILARFECDAKGNVVNKIDISPNSKKGMLSGKDGKTSIKGDSITIDQIKEVLNDHLPKPAKIEKPAKPEKPAKIEKPVKTEKQKAARERLNATTGLPIVKGINYNIVNGEYQMRATYNGKQYYITTAKTQEKAIELQTELYAALEQHADEYSLQFENDKDLIRAVFKDFVAEEKPKKPTKEKVEKIEKVSKTVKSNKNKKNKKLTQAEEDAEML